MGKLEWEVKRVITSFTLWEDIPGKGLHFSIGQKERNILLLVSARIS